MWFGTLTGPQRLASAKAGGLDEARQLLAQLAAGGELAVDVPRMKMRGRERGAAERDDGRGGDPRRAAPDGSGGSVVKPAIANAAKTIRPTAVIAR